MFISLFFHRLSMFPHKPYAFLCLARWDTGQLVVAGLATKTYNPSCVLEDVVLAVVVGDL